MGPLLARLPFRTFLLALWLIGTALPALCSGGFLSHICREHSTAGCEHEEACYEDPCNGAPVLLETSVISGDYSPVLLPAPWMPMMRSSGVAPSASVSSIPPCHPSRSIPLLL